MRHLLTSLVCLLMCYPTVATSNELAAIARDGRYLIINLDTFELADVGDLKRLGLFSIDNAIAGSSVREAILEADITTKQPAENGLYAKHVNVKLNHLGVNQSTLPPTAIIDFEEGPMRWVDGDKQKQIVFVQSGDTKLATLYDNTLKKVINSTTALPSGAGHGPVCIDANGKILIGAWYNKVTDPFGMHQTEKLDATAANKGFYLTPITSQCKALMSAKPDSVYAKTIRRRVIDIEKNHAMPIFDGHRAANMVLYNNGKYLLEQKLNSVAVGSGPGVKTTATGAFRIFQSDTGKLVNQFEIIKTTANLVKVVKVNSQNIAILVGQQQLLFLDLQSHKVVKTIKVPFTRFIII